MSPALAALIVEAGQRQNACRAHDVIHEAARERWLATDRQDAGFDAIHEESGRLDDLLYAAQNAITAFPAATLPDLIAMLDYMESQGTVGDDDCVAALAAGIRRVAA